jgi:hypothetical protein
MKATLEVELASPAAVALAPRLHALLTVDGPPPHAAQHNNDNNSNNNNNKTEDVLFVVTANRVAISSSGAAVAHVPSEGSTAAATPRTYPQSPAHPLYAAVFVPATVTESALEGASDFVETNDSLRAKISQRILRMIHPFLAQNCSLHGVLQVRHNEPPQQQQQQHPPPHRHSHFQRQHQQHMPADIALIDLSHTPTALLEEILSQTAAGGQPHEQPVLFAGPESLILKVLPIFAIQFRATAEPPPATTPKPDALHNIRTSGGGGGGSSEPASMATTSTTSTIPHPNNNHHNHLPRLDAYPDRTHLEIPSCPVCLHRIDPIRLGLPQPPTLQLCSKFCPPPNLLALDTASPGGGNGGGSSASTTRTRRPRRLDVACPQQRLLLPWPRPSLCVVCRTIDQYWQAQLWGSDEDATRPSTTDAEAPTLSSSSSGLVCDDCPMRETLWVCLTCGYTGCGRYSNKHAANHFLQSGHPFSLELATLRIWDYVTGGFVQRTDLLECPSSWPLLQPWIVAPSRSTTTSLTDIPSSPVAARPDASEKAPKKATMIGEEYEVLLQSALEEQAQYYEGELSHLRAKLTADQVDQSVMTEAEKATVESLQEEIAKLHLRIHETSRQLLEVQKEEARYRATSAQLLRQQQVAQDLVQKLEQETAQEQAAGRQQVDELEQQIADLTANERMRSQFSQNEELQQAQIWGMTTTSAARSPQGRGKKKRGKGRN